MTTDPSDVAAVDRLRKTASAELVSAALDLAKARQKAERKCSPEVAGTIVADVPGIEMASSETIATHKAQRIADTLKDYPSPNDAPFFDLCCGIGGDTRALARAGLKVVAVDQNPLRAWMASVNAQCESQAIDVMELDANSMHAFHIDPSRRSTDTAKRHWRFDDYLPHPDSLLQLLAACPNGVFKLGPGVNPEEVQALEGEIE